MIIKKHLYPNQYIAQRVPKRAIVLHHTAGGSATATLEWWANDNAKVGTAYVIDRDGTIYEAFPPECWSWHLGLQDVTNDSNIYLNKVTIGIELCNWGYLTERDGQYYNYVNQPVSNVYKLDKPYKGFHYFEDYTDFQLMALAGLIKQLSSYFKIPITPLTMDSFNYRNQSFFTTLSEGLYTHGALRSDKTDIYPHEGLIRRVNIG